MINLAAAINHGSRIALCQKHLPAKGSSWSRAISEKQKEIQVKKKGSVHARFAYIYCMQPSV